MPNVPSSKSHSSSPGPYSHPNLKRPLHAHVQQTDERRDSPSSIDQTSHQSSSGQDWRRPKVPRLDSSSKPGPTSLASSDYFPPFLMPPSSHRNTSSASPRFRQPPSSTKARGKGKSASLPALDEPLCDEAYIASTYNKVPFKAQWEENPKGPLSNYFILALGKVPEYDAVKGHVGAREVWRATVIVDDVNVVGTGDAASRKDAERLAALSAVRQLNDQGLLNRPKRVQGDALSSSATAPATVVKLSDGTTEVQYERARQFMDYYCRRFQFGKPDITFEEVKAKKARANSSWEAIMTVGGRRIGLGAGPNKKSAQTTCYLDVTQYLESCDPPLWKSFVEAAKTGKDLGMAPKVFFQMSEHLDDGIRNLCSDIRKSTLYKNRPTIGSAITGSDPVPESNSMVPIGPRRADPTLSEAALTAKAEHLAKRRIEYLADARLKAMQDGRAALPVHTRAAEILDHIRAHDVTICMATTGSGKTTQIPQLILDEWIEKGQGSRCNIVCTQPRRIAAISVAERVAKERGETTGGRGSIGYQVRFEANLPEDHGSITFCTTGTFLKRVQSALGESGGAGRSLDDVTHVVVDEVHERDVDTDLLLVVLKRLMADRKANNKPIKVVLMSATIDPTLFQAYFRDDKNKPASVIEVPGRSFPVEKHFLDDFVPVLRTMGGATNWVFKNESVVKYLDREMRPETWSKSLSGSSTVPSQRDGKDREDDLELPYPLIGLTIAHVLQKTDSGHVLVFLPGWDEIMAVQRCLLGSLGPLGINFSDSKKWSMHLLHSTIPIIEQQVIFDPPPEGVRRVILATNIAETSVTIPDVVYVVDTGKIKEQRYDPERHMSSLVSAWVGSSNLNQRAGRAGRHRPGEYYGILGRKRAAALHPYQTVEMKRVDLSNVVMHVKALDFPGVEVEDVLAATIEPPSAERVMAATKDLMMVGALDEKKNLTSLGRVLLQLPVEVQMGRLVLFGSFFRCLDQALTLAAILTNRDPFLSPMHLKEKAASVKHSWSPQEFKSDALATLQAYNAWWELQSQGRYVAANNFCSNNFLSKPTLLMIQRIKGHLLQALYRAGVIDVSAGGGVAGPQGRDLSVPPQLNTNGDSLPLLAALIAIGSQPNFAIRTGDKTYRTAQDKATFIHPSSVNHRKRELSTQQDGYVGEKQLFAFEDKRQNVSVAGSGSSTTYLMTTTRLDPMTYMLFGAYHIEVTERGLECDDWLPIIGNIDALDDVQRLKTLMESCMLRVFEGITMGRKKKALGAATQLRSFDDEGREDLDHHDQQPHRDYSLSQGEIKELDYLTRDIVQILNRYSEERVAAQSRQNSRPATPMASPLLSPLRLAPQGSRSGASTPYNIGSAYNSRPSTPSRLSTSHRF